MNKVTHFVRRIIHKVRTQIHHLRMRKFQDVPSGALITARWEGEQSKIRATKICLFASYDQDAVVDDYVVRQLEELKNLGFKVFFCTTSGAIKEADLARLVPLCALILQKKNVGLDFSSWSALWGLVSVEDKNTAERLLLTNDSCYGPFTSDLKSPSVFDLLEEAPYRICGLTESWQHKYHLQSYFLYIKFDDKTRHFISDFLSRIKNYSDKDQVIKCYEIGFSQLALTEGLTLGSINSYFDLRDNFYKKHGELSGPNYHEPLNPTIMFWDCLLESGRFPFLKTELLKRNPTKSSNVRHWRFLIADPNWKNMIIKHLMRVGEDAKL